MRRTNFAGSRPPGWIERGDLLAATGENERNLVEFRGYGIVPRPVEVASKRRGKVSYYHPASIPIIQRLHTLKETTPRNMDEWLWHLWLEEYPVDIRLWVGKHLASFEKRLDAVEAAGGIAALPLETPSRFNPSRAAWGRVRSKDDRRTLFTALFTIARGNARLDLLGKADGTGPMLLDLVLKAGGIRVREGPPDRELSSADVSLSGLAVLMDGAREAELKQARRDCLSINRLADTAEMIDWPQTMAALEPIAARLAPEPPSKEARKGERVRPRPAPEAVRFCLAIWNDVEARAVLLPFLILVRRSPDHGNRLTGLLAAAEFALSRFPRRQAPHDAR